jgi:fermentation-respiration switch protein FrsA (DUF1100 family)
MVILGGLLAAYVTIVALLWAFQERLAFPAPRAPLPDPTRVLGRGERIELVMQNGTSLVGWFVPPGRTAASSTAPTAALLWFYGNGETISAIWPILRDFQPPGTALLVVDYPGYGASGGETSEAGIYEAAALAYGALIARPDVDRKRIYVYGRSLGTAPATLVAAEYDVAGLILESPYTSAREMAARSYRIVPSFLVRLKLDNLSTIKRVRCPVLVFHGTADRLVPVDMGRRVAEAAPGPVEFVMIEGAGHNETYEVGGSGYREKVARFVTGH